jgi:hypothetical protein
MSLVTHNKRIVVFGAGFLGTALMEYLSLRGQTNHINCVAVSDTARNPNSIKAIPVIPLETIDPANCDVVIAAVFEDKHAGVHDLLKDRQFDNIQFITEKCYFGMREELRENNTESLLELQHNVAVQGEVIAELLRRLQRLDYVNEITSVNTAAFAEYENCFNGRDVVILATGPTLNKYKPIEGAIHIGVKSAYDFDRVKLDFYMATDFRRNPMWTHEQICYEGIPARQLKMNEPNLNGVIAKIARLDCTKFIGNHMHNALHKSINISESNFHKTGAKRYFVNSHEEYLMPNICFYPVTELGSVTHGALQFALWTNPAKIYLVGSDTDYSSGRFNEPASMLSNEYFGLIPQRAKIGFEKYRDFADQYYPQTEIISVNPVGLKGMFTDWYTE